MRHFLVHSTSRVGPVAIPPKEHPRAECNIDWKKHEKKEKRKKKNTWNLFDLLFIFVICIIVNTTFMKIMQNNTRSLASHYCNPQTVFNVVWWWNCQMLMACDSSRRFATNLGSSVKVNSHQCGAGQCRVGVRPVVTNWKSLTRWTLGSRWRTTKFEWCDRETRQQLLAGLQWY